jgi:hypothetical protein
MADAPVPGYQAYWAERRASLQSEYQVLIKQYPDANMQYRLLYKTLCDIEDVAGYTPAAVGESAEWTAIVSTAEDNRASYCKALSGKVLFSALYGTYTFVLNELKSLLKASTSAGGTTTASGIVKPTQEDGFKEVRRRKRRSTNEVAPTSKKPAAAATSTPTNEVATRNFFIPLRATTTDTDSGTEATTLEEAVPGKAGRPPPIILTSITNQIQLQRQLKNVAIGDFEFRNTENGTRVITKSMTDFEAVKSHFSTHNLSYYSFPKPQKPIKAVLRHLPSNTPAEDISDGLVTLGFDVVSVRQMTTTRRSPSEGTTARNLPLFLITIPRTANSQEIFNLNSLCHISIRVEIYRAQSGLTQCHNCQQFGHVWANCRQPPVVCGAGAATCIKSVQNRRTLPPLQYAVTASWWRARNPIQPITGAAGTRRRSCRRRNRREHPNLQPGGCFPQISLLQVSPSRRCSEAAHRKSSGL